MYSLIQPDCEYVAIPPPPLNDLPWFALKRAPRIEDDNKALDLPSEITFRLNAHNDMLVSKPSSEHCGFRLAQRAVFCLKNIQIIFHDRSIHWLSVAKQPGVKLSRVVATTTTEWNFPK